MKGPVPYLYYSLYAILDLFSRYVVGWMVAVKESAHLAERIEQTCHDLRPRGRSSRSRCTLR